MKINLSQTNDSNERNCRTELSPSDYAMLMEKSNKQLKYFSTENRFVAWYIRHQIIFNERPHFGEIYESSNTIAEFVV